MSEKEKRSGFRRRTLKAGSLEFGGGAFDCVVRNLSERGAAVEIENPVGIPERVVLHIAAENCRRAGRVVWKKAHRIGLEFD
ncbi:MAG: pilus assembly protein PilZ [Bradyrhizobiaceae bacterium PARB1]|jgi:PilZ domain|nr:MAG: pilus assembly protein PilZ [Bradyrhizobiaceae bacterium PARB1]